MSQQSNNFLLVSGIASIFMVDYSSIFPTDDRPIIDFFTPLLANISWNTFRDEGYVNPLRITVFPTFSTHKKHSLPVNMAVVINKHKIRDKSLDLLKKSLGNYLKYKKTRGYWDT